MSGLGPDDLVLALISGGGSALFCAPGDSLTLDDKMAVNTALLASEAPIGEMNIVRKHLSRIKGGQLAAACHPAQLVTILVSDVPGDDPGQIASGPTVGEDSTPADARAILARYGIVPPVAAQKALHRSSVVIAPRDPRLAGIRTQIAAAPSQSLAAAAQAARHAGCDVEILGDDLEGEARDLGALHARLARNARTRLTASGRPLLLLSGGECTVTRRGFGIGGPNAEYVLAAAIELSGLPGVHFLACDTDGVAGAAEIAGAYASPETLATALHSGLDARKALAQNDTPVFFGKTGGQVVTGPTLTKVNDFRDILIQPIDV